MKRFHVHLHVKDLDQSIAFYSKLFAAEPARHESDYAKWMLEDPAVNFAISTRGAQPGIDHLGIQTDDPADLAAMKARAEAADMALLDEGETTCCYARSEKHWVTDPQGVAWEHFHTLAQIPVFREAATAGTSACCTPAASTVAGSASAASAASCCTPAASTASASDSAATAAPCCTPASGATSAAGAAMAAEPAATEGACCTPKSRGKPIGIPVKGAPSSCC